MGNAKHNNNQAFALARHSLRVNHITNEMTNKGPPTIICAASNSNKDCQLSP
jgi:hypothetical protein